MTSATTHHQDPSPRRYEPQEQLDTLIKVRASLEPGVSVFWWEGSVYSFVPDRPDLSQEIFTMRGINVGRAIPTERGYDLLTREAAFYGDPHTGTLLTQWNPSIIGGPDRDLPVIPVWNDPVNARFARECPDGPFSVPLQDLGNGMICLSMDVFLAYPSPIPRDQYPAHSGSNMYQGAELFQFFVNKEHLADPHMPSAPASISWTRIGQWLPWMEMGERPGYLVYQCRGAKTIGEFQGVDPQVILTIQDEHPEFLEPPSLFTRPNQTSWRYYREHYLGADQRLPHDG